MHENSKRVNPACVVADPATQMGAQRKKMMPQEPIARNTV
jgi:hypothetical protein